MTFNEAVQIRTAQLHGWPVNAARAAEAFEVIQRQGAMHVVKEKKPRVVVETANPQVLEVPDLREWGVDIDAVHRSRE